VVEIRKRQTRIRPRAFFIGLFLAVVICAVTPFNNVYRSATPLGGGYFPLAPFYFLFWLTLAMSVTRKIFKSGPWLTGTELLFTWVIMVLVSGIAYTGFARTFFINLTAPFYFSNVENQWLKDLVPLIPGNLLPGTASAVELLYNGIDGGRDKGWLDVAAQVPWKAWLLPFLSWGIFILSAYFLILCLVHMIARQAMENERMNFPLLILPRMIQEAFDKNQLRAFWFNKYLLMGLAIPACLHLLNGLNFYFPSFPHINTLVLAGPYFPRQGIFAGFIKLKLYFYPAFIGFAFLASKQVSFSFWFFFILGAFFTGVLSVSGLSLPESELGATFGPTLSRPEEVQMIGAFLVFAFFLVWMARFHFKDVAQNALGLNRGKLDPEQVVDKFAFWGTGAGFVALTGWFVFHGVSLVQSVVLILFFLIFTMVAVRVVCQGGITYFTLNVAPLDAMNTIFGLKMFSGLGLLLAGISQKVMFVDLRESVAPSILHGLRITRRAKGQMTIAGMIFLTMAVCLAVSAMAMILLCYKYGIRELQLDWATRTTLSMYNQIQPLMSHADQGNSIIYFTLLGGLVMGGLVFCYHRFYWWPLHPIGYLMIYSSAMKILWISFFIGWMFNTLCMRYGGIRLFKKMRFFFAGMIMGDFLMGGSWALIGLFTETGYQVLPN